MLVCSILSTLLLLWVPYCDIDSGTCNFSIRSLSGYAIFFGTSLIPWKTKKQKTVCEGCMSYTSSELIWLESLLQDLQVHVPFPIDLFCDNKVAHYITKNHTFQERTKILKIDCHFIRDFVDSEFLKILHVTTTLQLANILTKSLGSNINSLILSLALYMILVESRLRDIISIL